MLENYMVGFLIFKGVLGGTDAFGLLILFGLCLIKNS